MKKYWEMVDGYLGKRTLRERLVMFLALALMLSVVLDTFLLSPLYARQEALAARAVQQQERMKAQQAGLQMLLDARSQSESSPLRRQVDELRKHLQEQEIFLEEGGKAMVEPSRMSDLLQQVLEQNGKVELVELKTLPVSIVGEKAAGGEIKPAAGSVPPVFRHGVRLSVRGRYPDLLRYVTELEHIPVRMSWGEAELGVERYPDAVLSLTIYTLSLERTWLTI